MTVNERIKQLRIAKGLTQKELGLRLGVSQQQVYNWEHSARVPNYDSIVRIAKALDTSPEKLVIGIEPVADEKSIYEKLKDLVDCNPIKIQYGWATATLCKSNKYPDGYNFEEAPDGTIVLRCL